MSTRPKRNGWVILSILSLLKLISRPTLMVIASTSLVFWGCAHKSGVGPSDSALSEKMKSEESDDEDEENIKPLVQVKEVESFRISDPQPPVVQSEELETIPVEMNEKVEQWIKWFQGRGRQHMERYLSRSTQYSDLMKRILRKNGLPEDLIYIALIESGFSSKATSRAAAVGYWQFIRGTGKRYGLEISSLVDERRDPVLSTQAAAEYYKSLYSAFGSWYLAMASYNVGENRVKREIMKNYTRDFWVLARKRKLPKETINYVPKFIAAKLIGRDPVKYGFNEIEYDKPVEFELIRVDKPLNLKTLANRMGLDYDDFKQINPKFKGEVAPVKGNGVLELRVPIGMTKVAMESVKESVVDRVEFVADTGETIHYKVRSGDSLFTIAKKFKTSINWIKEINELKPGRKLRVGQRLIVPEPGSSSSKKKLVAKNDAKAIAKLKEKEAREKEAREKEDAKREEVKKEVAVQEQEKATTKSEVVKNGKLFYIVQPGDTLSEIAEEYDSTIQELRKMNKLGKRIVLKPGMRLKVPQNEGLPSDPNEIQASSDGQNAKDDSNVEDEKRYIVQAGENLIDIAKKHGVSVEAIKKANRIKDQDEIKAGERIIIPKAGEPQGEDKNQKSVESSSTHRYLRKVASQKNDNKLIREIGFKQIKSQDKMRSLSLAKGSGAKHSTNKRKFYVVKSGDSLTQIAMKHQIPLVDLIHLNRLKNSDSLMVGTRLSIPLKVSSR